MYKQKKLNCQQGMPILEQPKVRQLNKQVNNTNGDERIHRNLRINQAILLLSLTATVEIE